MKAIIVIDMPVNGCNSCMFDTYGFRCLIKANMKDLEKMNDSSYCPLKPMPEKKTKDEEFYVLPESFEDGWNACLEELEK